ncbi:MAG: BTAD domain-containing putative transcriptional regulator [Actinomycetes bacterium]
MRHAASRGPRRTAREIGAGLLSAVALLAAVVGPPILLYAIAGVPIPHHTPSPGQITHSLTSRDNGQLFLAALLVIAWVGWAVFTLSVAVETAAVIRGRAAIRLPGCALSQQLAGALVAAASVLLLATPPPPTGVATHEAAALLPLLSRTPVVATATADPPLAAHGHPNGVAPHGAQGALEAEALPRCTVERGDTLWAIAERHLGDPERWQEIARLNYDRPQPGGRTLTDSHWIYPGWELLLPADATNLPHITSATSPPRHEPRQQATAPAPPMPPHTTPTTAPSVAEQQQDRPTNTTRSISAQSPTVELDSGSRLGAAFAAGVLAALATGRLRRRRHYRPQPPAPGRVPGAPPTPRALRDLLAATRGDDDTEQSGDAPITGDTAPAAPAGHPARASDPDVIDVGDRDGQPVPLALTGWKGLGLRGPGAEQTARAWLADLLTRTAPYGAEILAPAALLDRLFPSAPTLPGLRPVADVESTLRELDAETLRRTRLLDTADLPDAASYRQAHPEDPLPVLVAIIDTIAPADLGRWRATLDAGPRLAIDALTLGTTADTEAAATATLDVDTDGVVHAVHPERLARTMTGTRLFAMHADDAAQLLGPIAALHRVADDEPPATIDLTQPGSATPTIASRSARAELSPDQATALSDHTATTDDVSWPAGPTRAGGDAVISVQMLGPLRIHAWGQEITTGLRGSARELFAWYLMHPQGTTADAAIEALWPDAPLDRGPERFWTALGNLRSRLRGPDQQHLDVLVKTGDVYTPQADMLDVDLWRFQTELRNAAPGGDDGATLAALREATNLFRDDLVAPADYLWIESAREDLHRRALDAHARLAELHARAGRLDEAIDTLEHAIVLDPVAEEMYRRLIVLLARVGRTDAINRMWIQLQARLADLDVDPEPETAALVRRAKTANPEPLALKR